MTVKFKDVLDLFEMVNFGSPFDHQGYVCRETGKTYFYSEYQDLESELPDDIEDERYLMIPDKRELGLGTDLVYKFTEAHLPNEYDRVRSVFRKKGAYSTFKSLLEAFGKVEQWYQYEAEQTETALRTWCLEHKLDIVD